MKRFTLLALTNMSIILGFSFICYYFKIHLYMNKIGLNYWILLVFAFFWGFLGAGISLLLSKFIAKWFMGVRIINQKEPKLSFFEKKLLGIIKDLADKSNIKMPDVGFYDANEFNAFATGSTKNNSLIAFTSNIFNVMDWEEIEAIAAHEISHIKNGDMVSMTLIQGSINAFAMFLSRIIGFSLINSITGEKGKFLFFTYYIYNWIILFFEGIFLFFGNIVANFYSRRREYLADESAAHIVGKRKVIKALYTLMKLENPEQVQKELQDQLFISLKIQNQSAMKFFDVFSTHPSLEKRIKRIKSLNISEDIDNMDLSKMTQDDII